MTRQQIIDSLTIEEVILAAHNHQLHEKMLHTECDICLREAIVNYTDACDPEKLGDRDKFISWLEGIVITEGHYLVLHDEPNEILDWWHTVNSEGSHHR